MARNLTPPEIDAIEDGATILGCGGGGPRWAGELLRDYVKAQIGAGQVVRLAEVEDIKDQDVVAVVAVMGNLNSRKDLNDPVAYKPVPPPPVPLAAYAKYLQDIVMSFEQLDKDVFEQTGKHLTHALPLEMGSGNSLVPMVVAAAKGIPVVDASGAERAVPVLNASSFAQAGLKFESTRVILVDPNGNVHRLDAATAQEAEDKISAKFADPTIYQPGVPPFGFIALWPMSGATMKAAVVPRTLDKARYLGTVLATAKNAGQSEPLKVMEALGEDEQIVGPAELSKGLKPLTMKCTGTATKLAEGIFEVIDRATEEKYSIVFANENMLMRGPQGYQVSTPELICALRKVSDQEREHWFAFTNDTLADGDELAVIVANSDPTIPGIGGVIHSVPPVVDPILIKNNLPPFGAPQNPSTSPNVHTRPSGTTI